MTSAFSARPVVALVILLLTASCYSFKPIAKSSVKPITGADLESTIAPGNNYEIVLKPEQTRPVTAGRILVKIRKVTRDTIFCDIRRTSLTQISHETGEPEINFYNNISSNGLPTNNKWPWADPDKRLIGLGHININSIAEVRGRTYSAGKTTFLITGILLTPIILVAVAASSLNFSGMSFPNLHP